MSRADRMERFERGVVFRVARAFFFFVAITAVLVFVTGGGSWIRGALKAKVAAPAAIPPPAPLAPLSYADVAAHVKAEAEQSARLATRPGTETAPAPSSPREPTRDPYREKLDALSARLKQLFPDPPYAWENVVETVCTQPTDFGCLRRETRVKKAGVVGKINAALERVDGDSFVHVVEVLIGVLEQAPVEERETLLTAVLAMEQARLERERAQRERWAAEVERQRQEYLATVAANEHRHATWRMWGMYGVAAGFALLIVVSLFLAFLAMERHLRLLQRLVANGATAGYEREAHGMTWTAVAVPSASSSVATDSPVT
jgi:hypothetical protein